MRHETEVISIKKKTPKAQNYEYLKYHKKPVKDAKDAVRLSDWGTRMITKELLLAIGDEVSRNVNGDIVVDYKKGTCKKHAGQLAHDDKRECISIYTIKPCGCILRTDQHIIFDYTGELKQLYNEDVNNSSVKLPTCKKHR